MKAWLFILFLLTVSTTWAQEESDLRQIYLQAEEEYNIGHFDASIRLLDNGMPHFKGALKVSAYRLLSLCHLGKDQPLEAERFTTLLLKEDPYYNATIHDPLRFADMVERLKRGEQTTITTASQQAESVQEAPVPVTVITEKMIEAIEANSLKEVLATYVPGITVIEGNSELNVAMHGVYSSEQQKILILLNGHRLNSRSTNAQAPDYSISMDKVKQIEVLRGPASSLYGNAAVTAVVNIITKDGRDLNGVSAKVGIGSFDTYKADLLFGKSGLNMNILAWTSVYASEGEKIFHPASATGVWRYFPLDGYTYINGFNRKPAYDIGCILQWDRNWKLYLNHQHAKMQSTYAYIALKAPYVYDKYRRINGQMPGHSRTVSRAELEYNNAWGKFTFDANAYVDMEQQLNYEIDGDSLPPGFILSLPEGEIMDSIVATRGFFQTVSWTDFTYGIMAKSTYSYGKESGMHGTLLFGGQFEQYRMVSSEASVGEDFDKILLTMSQRNSQIHLGSEWTFSTFFQGKHFFSPRLIANIGMRFDYKHRFNGKTMYAFSPRIALIYKLNNWNLKASYARSFVDAPYFYRANKVASYRGSENLNPEYLDALQLSALFSMPSIYLEYDCNLYYNRLNGILYNDKSAANTERPVYTNAGFLNLFGVENSFSYTPPGLDIRMNLTYQRVLDSQNYSVTGSKINGVPAISMNLVVSKSLLQRAKQSLWATASLSCYSKQNMPVSGIKDGVSYTDLNYKIKASSIVDLALRYKFKRIETSLVCKNLLDTRYTRASSYDIDVLQQGRSFMWKIGYNF